ncbi:hypothetical protein, partial [Mesotoga sp.]|uniref:hypothetical protein n=1 Tax=Mesotoga sp. TaxID=2053577 RepID=UPI001BD2061A
MRKLSFALLVISTILIISSCMVPKTEIERLVPPNDATEDVIFAAQSSNGVYSANLIVGADTVIGRIDYWVDNDQKLLHIEFSATEDGWLLNETRVATALTVADLPRSPGSWLLNPKLFPNYNIHNPGELVSKFVISLESLEANTTKIYFSAYAEALRKENKYFSQIGITAPCIYFAIVYTEPVVELRPILKVDVEGEVDLSRVTNYDWEITKEASPEAISNLKQGDSASVEYTLTATRLTPQATDTYTLTGIATVTNEGSLQAEQVGLKVFLLGKNGGDWVEIESKTLIETSSNTTIAASDLIGIGKPFTFEFNPGDYSEVRILAEATDNWPEIVDDFEDHLIPISPSSQTFIDESASVIDMPRNLVEFENLGFSVDNTGTWPWSVSPWVLTDVNGGSKKYSIVITNVDAPLGSYTLTNDATLTENDTLTKREAFARVLVSTPEPQEDILTLEATVTGSFKWDREIEYDWEIEKSVSPETIYLGIGEDADVTYTVNATRTLTDNATDTFSYKGEVEVGNSLTSNLTASEVSLTISLLESSDGGTFAVAQTSTQPIVDLAPGDKVAKSFDFSSYSFVSGYYYGVKAEVVSGVVLKTNTGALTGPISPNLTEYDMTATVNDGYMVPVGFDVTPDSDYVWPWLLSETPAATTYTFNIVNKEKETGEFKVPNTVTLVEDDTKQERSDDATVTILVPGLNVTVDSTITWVKTLEYDWNIEKEATPTLVTLGIGEESSIQYTIETERTPGDATYTYTISGTVTVENTGNIDLTNISGSVSLEGYPSKSDNFDPFSLAIGANQDFMFSFTVESATPISGFTISANADSDETAPDSDSDTQTSPEDPEEVVEIDETADLEDLITNVPTGFSITPSTLDRSWSLTGSDTKTYSLTLKNVGALPTGSPYYLTNTATVTEDDTSEKSSDDAEVKINVPAPGLNALVGAEVSREDKVEYDWTIDKSASPTVVTLGIGEEAPIDYTIKVTREPWETVDSTYTITVNAKVKNTGPGSALGVKIVLKITETGDEVTLADGITMIEGEEKSFDRTFTTKTYSPSYTAVLSVTSSNDGSPSGSDTGTTPSDPNIVEYVDETADLEDLITSVPAGFSINPSTLDLSWPDLSDSASKTFSLTLKNVSALPSGNPYFLTNTATVTEDDTPGDYASDDAEVKINVPEDKDLEIANEHDMEWDQTKEYSWEIEKSAVPESIELNEGEDGTFAYTLLATRTLEETNIATLTGLATVTNTGNVALTNINVE